MHACACVLVCGVQLKDPLNHQPPPMLNADPLWCEVRGIAGYPTVTFEDVRVVSSSVGIAQYLRLTGLEGVAAAPKVGAVKRRGSTVIRCASDVVGGCYWSWVVAAGCGLKLWLCVHAWLCVVAVW
jgi:hypothetical protein